MSENKEKETDEAIDKSISSESDGFDSSYSDVTSPVINRRLTDPLQRLKVEEANGSIEESCKHMMEKVGEYLNGELTATCEDYKLLQKLNEMAIVKYQEMSSTTTSLITNMQDMNEKYKALIPYLSQIDLLEESVIKLEQTAYKLDSYSKELEMKFKSLEKK